MGLAACGSDDDDSSSAGGSGGISGDTLTIYSSLPLQGTSKGQSEAVINGEKLALKEAGNKVGKYKIKYVSLDDSTAQNPGTADEGQTAQNARKAVQDTKTIFYLGEFNSGGTKVSLPILNKANIPQISPSNTYVGLTTDEPGSEPGEPDKYYPAQKRTYARIVPDGHDPGRGARDDHEGGRLQVRPHLQRQDHLRRGSREEHRAAPRRRRPDGRGQRRHRQERAELPLAGREDQGRLLRRLGRDRRELRPGVQGRGGGLPELQALRTGRRRRGGVHRSEGGRHPGRRRRPHQGHGRHARPRGVREAGHRPRPRSSSRTSRRSTA